MHVYAVITITKFYFIYMIYRHNRLLLRIFEFLQILNSLFSTPRLFTKLPVGVGCIALYTGYRRKCTRKAIDNAYRGQTRRNLRVFTKNSIS